MISDISNLKVRLFYIASLIAILGHSIDALFIETHNNVVFLNGITVLLLLIIFALFHFTLISSNLANSIIIYSVLLNALISILIKTHLVNLDALFYQTSLLYAVLLIYSGFSLARSHLFFLSLIYILFYLFFSFYSDSSVLFHNMPINLLLLVSFLIGMNAIVKILNEYNKEQLVHIENMGEVNQLLEENGIELKKLNATKDKLLSILGHDLRTPANSIMGFAELIMYKAQNIESNSILEYSNHIYQASNSLNLLIGDLLDWARLQTGNAKVYYKTINMNSIINDTIELMHATIYLKKINVFFNDSNEIEIKADKQMLATVIRNLLTNALKYTPKEGSISIESKCENNQYIFCINDSGVGMDELTLSSLFTDVAIASKPGTDFEKGTGIGLATCKGYIKLLNGKIWAESEHEKGSSFKFSIPINVKNYK